jgi:hypothetical protein
MGGGPVCSVEQDRPIVWLGAHRLIRLAVCEGRDTAGCVYGKLRACVRAVVLELATETLGTVLPV